MIEKVNQFIKKHRLMKKDSTVIVGVSGGPDSLALLHFLSQQYKEITLIAAHVDHMFRGKESEEDLVYVKEFCETYRIPFESIQFDVTSYKKEHGISSQVAAREVRYDFFDEMMKKYNADYLALGHHGDDQIETILMRLTRGSKGIGYAGMQIRRPFSCGTIIRPLLVVTKSEIEKYCTDWGLAPRQDPSNDKDDYTRNRFRHFILPFLKQENPTVHEQFLQFNQQLTEDNQVLDELTKEKMNKVMKRNGTNEIEIEIPSFLMMPKSLQRRGIQLILNYLYKELPPSLSAVHIDNLLTFLASSHPSGELQFPAGLRIVKSYTRCTYTFTDCEEPSPYRFRIDTPGLYKLEDGSKIKSQVWKTFPEHLVGNDCLIIDPTSVRIPIYVRTRKVGDKMTLKGMNGSKKVKDIFIDKKIPLHRRNLWPIVEDDQGEILWLPGLKKSSYEATSKTQSHYIVLQYTQ